VSKRLMIIAGEASGDMYGGRLVKSLKEMVPDLTVYGVGGDAMAEAGVDLVVDIKDLSVMGIAEVLAKIVPLMKIRNKLVSNLKANPPDGLIVIDFPGMNINLAGKAKELGIPVVYYVAPKLWVSRKGRIKKIRESVDRILAIFPFEEEFYRSQGVPVKYVGNPIVDFLKDDTGFKQFCERFSINGRETIIGILPGSRPAEIQRMLPVFLQAAKLISLELDGPVRFFLPRASTVSEEMLVQIIQDSGLDVDVIEGESRAVLQAADVSIVASGTATLEAFLLGALQVVAYKTSWLTYFLGMRLLNVPRVSLPNLLTGKDVVIELLQHQAIPERLAREALGLLASNDARTSYLEAAQEVRLSLKGEGASKLAAEAVIEVIETGK